MEKSFKYLAAGVAALTLGACENNPNVNVVTPFEDVCSENTTPVANGAAMEAMIELDAGYPLSKRDYEQYNQAFEDCTRGDYLTALGIAELYLWQAKENNSGEFRIGTLERTHKALGDIGIANRNLTPEDTVFTLIEENPKH